MWKVKNSKIHGKGIVASQNIKSGTRLSNILAKKYLEKKVTKGLVLG